MTIHTGLAILSGIGSISVSGTIPSAIIAAGHTYIEEEGGEQQIASTHLYVEEENSEQQIAGVQLYVEEHYIHPNPSYPGEYDAGPMAQILITLD